MPALRRQYTDEVAWSPLDFATAGALLFGTGLAFELITRKTGALAYRLAVGLALLAALSLVWINLAVGIIGSEDNPANMMYLGVLAILILGALMARFRPQGMTRTLFATALAQVMVAVIALTPFTYTRGTAARGACGIPSTLAGSFRKLPLAR
jgi:hypothetical protein